VWRLSARTGHELVAARALARERKRVDQKPPLGLRAAEDRYTKHLLRIHEGQHNDPARNYVMKRKIRAGLLSRAGEARGPFLHEGGHSLYQIVRGHAVGDRDALGLELALERVAE